MYAPVLLAQLSDLHIKAGGRLSYGVVDTLGALRAAVELVRIAEHRARCRQRLEQLDR